MSPDYENEISDSRDFKRHRFCLFAKHYPQARTQQRRAGFTLGQVSSDRMRIPASLAKAHFRDYVAPVHNELDITTPETSYTRRWTSKYCAGLSTRTPSIRFP
jgi:hypothetical protein